MIINEHFKIYAVESRNAELRGPVMPVYGIFLGGGGYSSEVPYVKLMRPEGAAPGFRLSSHLSTHEHILAGLDSIAR